LIIVVVSHSGFKDTLKSWNGMNSVSEFEGSKLYYNIPPEQFQIKFHLMEVSINCMKTGVCQKVSFSTLCLNNYM